MRAPGARTWREKVDIVIYGSGGHGKVLADAAGCAGDHVVGFLDDNPQLKGRMVMGHPVLGGAEDLATLRERGVRVAVAIGNNATRRRVAVRVTEAGLEVASIVHPSAVIARSARLGTGVQVLAKAVVGPEAQVGDGVIVNTGATVDHDCVLGAYCQVNPGVHIAGTVTVGEEAFIGTGASVIPGMRIGARTTVGAGAVVVEDLPPDVVAMGVPARVTRQLMKNPGG